MLDRLDSIVLFSLIRKRCRREVVKLEVDEVGEEEEEKKGRDFSRGKLYDRNYLRPHRINGQENSSFDRKEKEEVVRGKRDFDNNNNNENNNNNSNNNNTSGERRTLIT